MTYRPKEFWDRRLAEQFDLRGTGETGLSLAYNRACYTLRREVLDRALAAAGMDPRGRRVLDVGCGTGFWSDYYVARGAELTGVDIAPTSVERLRKRHPSARFLLSDVSEVELGGTFDIVNVFDILYHIVDDTRFEAALRNCARAVAPGGLLLVTDSFSQPETMAAHNRMRPMSAYARVLDAERLTRAGLYPTHVFLNRELGRWRFLNRLPAVLLAADRLMLARGIGEDPEINKLLVARRAS